MAMNVSGLFQVAGCIFDSEHQRIMRELRAMGIEPTGNKSTDKAKLQEAKAAQKANQAEGLVFVSKTEEGDKVGAQSSFDYAKNSPDTQAQNMQGATMLGELNRYKLLGF